MAEDSTNSRPISDKAILTIGSGIKPGAFTVDSNFEPASWPSSISPKSGPSIQEQGERANRALIPYDFDWLRGAASVRGQPQWEPNQQIDEPNGDLTTRVLRLENLACALLYTLNNVSASCSAGVIVITFPSLPAIC